MLDLSMAIAGYISGTRKVEKAGAEALAGSSRLRSAMAGGSTRQKVAGGQRASTQEIFFVPAHSLALQ
jgi:hypothetical protein